MKQVKFTQPKTAEPGEIPKIDLSMPKIKKKIDYKAMAIAFRNKTLKVMAASGTVCAVAFSMLVFVNAFFQTHYFSFQSPVVLQSPVLLHTRELKMIGPIPEVQAATQSAVPVATVSAVIVEPTGPNVEKMVKAIRFLESTNGTAKEGLAVYCAKKGMSNEYGFGGMAMMKCFENHEVATARVTKWVNDHLPRFENDEARTMCWYNLGLEVESCEYSSNYYKIKDTL